MSLKKQKDRLISAWSGFSGKLLAWLPLELVVSAMLTAGAFGLIFFSQPTGAQTPLTTEPVASKWTPGPVWRPRPRPPAPVQQPAAAVSRSQAVATAKTLPRAGTPKAEPVVTPSPNSSVSGLTPTAPTAQNTHVTTGYASTNWSGYMAVTGTFTGVSGSWHATFATGNGSPTSADSTWIGIGGVTSGDLIQVGTENIINASGQVSTSAFYEMLPNFAQTVPGVTVSPGDSMSASISQASSGVWAISITDNTDGQSYTTTVSYASSLSSAEWIEEDPSFSFRRQIPFDNFQSASFAGGSTVMNGASVNISASTAQPVIMVNSANQVIAAPSAIGADGASFTVTP